MVGGEMKKRQILNLSRGKKDISNEGEEKEEKEEKGMKKRTTFKTKT